MGCHRRSVFRLSTLANIADHYLGRLLHGRCACCVAVMRPAVRGVMRERGVRRVTTAAVMSSAGGKADMMQDGARYDFPVLQFAKLSLAPIGAARKV